MRCIWKNPGRQDAEIARRQKGAGTFPGIRRAGFLTDMKQIEGQIGLFDDKPVNEKNESLGEPCEHCDVEWCSAKCFQRRGYMWDRLHRFIKGDDGKPLRKQLEDRICKEIRFDK